MQETLQQENGDFIPSARTEQNPLTTVVFRPGI